MNPNLRGSPQTSEGHPFTGANIQPRDTRNRSAEGLPLFFQTARRAYTAIGTNMTKAAKFFKRRTSRAKGTVLSRFLDSPASRLKILSSPPIRQGYLSPTNQITSTGK